MTKTDFAELKEKLVSFDNWHIHERNSVIISVLIEIIQSQSEALEKYQEKAWRFDERDTHRETFAAHTCLSETTTRLQKLRDGK